MPMSGLDLAATPKFWSGRSVVQFFCHCQPRSKTHSQPMKSNPVFVVAFSVLSVAMLIGVAAAEPEIPDFSSTDFGWMKTSANYLAPASGPGPVGSDTAHPYRNIYSPRIADVSNPILQPWVAEALRKNNAAQLAGTAEPGLHARCLPGGVPAFFLFGGNVNPIYIAQSKGEVLLINQADTQVRHVYIDVPHSTNVRSSWYGESVGHYENGNTLVVDTVGLSERATVDNYETPHTDRMHVIERYTL